ncbi:hypothetical protein DXG01_015561 [Tephrocybe rancida]|nr:hypothetical protein DXG01_015561 [Tephrocybe rancida]
MPSEPRGELWSWSLCGGLFGKDTSPRFQAILRPGELQDVQVLADELGSYAHNSRYDFYATRVKVDHLKTDPATKHIVTSIYAGYERYSSWKSEILDRLQEDEAAKEKADIDLLTRQFVKCGRAKLDVRVFFDRLQTKVLLFEHIPKMESRKDLARWIHHNVPLLLVQFDSYSAMMANIYASKAWKLTPPGRRDDVLSIWDSYLKSIGATLPFNGADILLSEPFYTMVNAPSGTPIDKGKVMSALAVFADHHVPITMETLSQRETSMLIKDAMNHVAHNYSINSAASVFSCSGCYTARCLTGWNTALLHQASEDCFGATFDDQVFRINEDGCIAALSLMEMHNIDPQVTLAEGMDNDDLHFTCMSCPEEDGNREILSWREAVRSSLRDMLFDYWANTDQ